MRNGIGKYKAGDTHREIQSGRYIPENTIGEVHIWIIQIGRYTSQNTNREIHIGTYKSEHTNRQHTNQKATNRNNTNRNI